MGSQYDRIDDVEAQLEPQAKLNSASTNLTASNTNANSNTGQKKGILKNVYVKIENVRKKTRNNGRIGGLDNLTLDTDRSDIITNSSSSLHDRESLMLREQLWYKNRIILISLASIIILVIILITLFALEPWKT